MAMTQAFRSASGSATDVTRVVPGSDRIERSWTTTKNGAKERTRLSPSDRSSVSRAGEEAVIAGTSILHLAPAARRPGHDHLQMARARAADRRQGAQRHGHPRGRVEEQERVGLDR